MITTLSLPSLLSLPSPPLPSRELLFVTSLISWCPPNNQRRSITWRGSSSIWRGSITWRGSSSIWRGSSIWWKSSIWRESIVRWGTIFRHESVTWRRSNIQWEFITRCRPSLVRTASRPTLMCHAVMNCLFVCVCMYVCL